MIDIELRARDLERESRTDPGILDCDELLALMVHDAWTVRMHICRMLGRVSWPADVYPEVLEFALAQSVDKNTFVRAWALDALATFAFSDDSIRERVIGMLESALEKEPASVRVRAREGLKRLMA